MSGIQLLDAGMIILGKATMSVCTRYFKDCPFELMVDRRWRTGSEIPSSCSAAIPGLTSRSEALIYHADGPPLTGNLNQPMFSVDWRRTRVSLVIAWVPFLGPVGRLRGVE